MAESSGLYEKLQKKYKRTVKANMQELKVYQPQFDTLINVYSGMLAQYEILTQRLIDNEFNIEVETQRGGTRKSATATALERLRADLVIYSDRLMLSPKALVNTKTDPKRGHSKLDQVLSELTKGAAGSDR
mgnify:CR=1 FL=1